MNATDKAEALRLLSELNESVSKYADAIRNDKRKGMTMATAAEVDKHVDALRSLLSAQEAEPVADHNVEAVRTKLLDRSRRGIAKYGTTTERDDLSLQDWLVHMQEELLDGAVYIQAAMRNGPEPPK